MNKEKIIKLSSKFIEESKNNIISEEIALSDKLIGMKIFEEPIFGFGDPNDYCFTILKKKSVIGDHFLSPKEWLSNSKTVISFFLPFTESVRESNRNDTWPSDEWLHGRIEGQKFLNKFSNFLADTLEKEGYNCIIPSMDKRFWSKTENKIDSLTEITFTSNWSERHVAYVCGLGTFGLSKGLITKKGMAGRFGSIVTNLHIMAEAREYTEIYEYCTLCGACITKCPVHAISLEKKKDHLICSRFLDKTAERFKPRYACGKCQVGVPCESHIPKAK